MLKEQNIMDETRIIIKYKVLLYELLLNERYIFNEHNSPDILKSIFISGSNLENFTNVLKKELNIKENLIYRISLWPLIDQEIFKNISIKYEKFFNEFTDKEIKKWFYNQRENGSI